MNKSVQVCNEDDGGSAILGRPKSSSNIVTGSILGEISVELIKSEDRTRSAPQISALMERTDRSLAGSEGNVLRRCGCRRKQTAIDIEIAGHDLDNMSEAADKLKNKLATYEGCLTFRILTPEVNEK